MKNLNGYKRRFAVWALLLCIDCAAICAKENKSDTLPSRMISVEQKMAEEHQEIVLMQREVSVCEKELNFICEHVDRANEEISNQIAASSHTIQVWGWIIAIMAIVMSVAGVWYARYINKMRKDITHLLSEAQGQLRQAEEVTDGIEEQQQRVSAQQQEIKRLQDDTEAKVLELQVLHSDIQNNMHEIYIRLRGEETQMLIERLQEIPEDISNVLEVLLSRNLTQDDFQGIYKAYQNLISRALEFVKDKDIDSLRQTDGVFAQKEVLYLIVFMQHFFAQALQIQDLRIYMVSKFEYLCGCLYRNDAEKCTNDLKIGVETLSKDIRIEVISHYIIAISKTRFSRFKELYDKLLIGLSKEELYEIKKKVSGKANEIETFTNSYKEIFQQFGSSNPTIAAVDA